MKNGETKIGWFKRFDYWLTDRIMPFADKFLAWNDRIQREAIPYDATMDIKVSNYKNVSEYLSAIRQRQDEYIAQKARERKERVAEQKARRSATWGTFWTLFFFSRLFK